MRERWSTVIPQRTKQRVGVDLIAWTSQKAAAVVTAEVIAVRGDGGAVVDDVFPECAGVEDRVDLICRLSLHVVDATSRACRVAANCAVSKLNPSGTGDAATDLAGGVTADCAVSNLNPPLELLMPPPASPAELPLIVLFTMVTAAQAEWRYRHPRRTLSYR